MTARILQETHTFTNEICVHLRVVNHFAEQKYSFTAIFFYCPKRYFDGILDAVAEAEMPGEKNFHGSKVEHGWRKIFFQLVGLLSFILDGTDKRTPV